MTNADIPRIAEIHIFGQRQAYKNHVPDDILFGKMTVAKRIQYFDSNAFEGYVYDTGIIKAFTTMGPCQDADKPHSFELLRIFVDPFMQGQGIGQKMADHFEQRAAMKGYTDLCIWALECNTSAAAFYEKLGYQKDGARKISGYFNVPEIRFSRRLTCTTSAPQPHPTPPA